MSKDLSLGDEEIVQKSTSNDHLLVNLEAIEIEEEEERSESIRTILNAQPVLTLFFGQFVLNLDDWLRKELLFSAPKRQFTFLETYSTWFQVFRI